MPEPNQWREEIDRVAESGPFRNAEALRRLLRYLADASLRGVSRELKEYTVGIEGLGKPSDYDPRTDSSVRVQAGKLRQKLDEYYRNEGAGSPLRIEFPKGHFELRLVEQPAVPPTPAAGPPAPGHWKALSAGLAAALLVLLGVVFYLWPRRVEPGPVLSPEQESFWRPFLNPKRPLVIVMGSPFFVRLHSAYVRDPEVNDLPSALRQLPLRELAALLKSPTPPTETRRFVGFGEASAAFHLSSLLAPVRPGLQLRRSTVLAWEDVMANDLIFLGPPKFNPQLRDLPFEQDFVVEHRAVWNRRPRPGESEVYRKPSAPEQDDIPEEYSLITRVAGGANRGELLVLASTSTEGTWAAAEYMTSPSLLKELMTKLRQPDGSIPDSYQVVVRGQFKSQVPIRIQYVTHHVLKPV